VLGEFLNKKECPKCHRFLPLSSFSKDKRTKDKRRCACKDCAKKLELEYMEKWAWERSHGMIDIPTEKECTRCHRILPISSFGEKKKNRIGRMSACKECDRERQKKYNSRPEVKAKLRGYRREYRDRPEVRERMKEYNKEFIKKPEQRKRIIEYEQRPERKAKKKEYNKKYLSRPEVKEHIKQYQAEYYSIP